jgi:type II secretory pathway pseudopilin PulG
MRRRHTGTRRQREGGFALLLVFLMAAIIGITLYMELPRIAFESQRQKEQLLMERGEQYQIAIRRYMQRGLKAGMMQGPPPTWPGKIEDLESSNGRRFLRKRYIDPMTGKDEWRLIHINGGVLTDSVNNKPQNNTQQAQSQAGQGIAEFAGLGQTQNGATPQGVAAANRRRPSDSNPNTPGSGDPGTESTANLPAVHPFPVRVPIPDCRTNWRPEAYPAWADPSHQLRAEPAYSGNRSSHFRGEYRD